MKPAQEEVVKASVTLYDGIIWALTSFFLFFLMEKALDLESDTWIQVLAVTNLYCTFGQVASSL